MNLARLVRIAALVTFAGCGKPSQELCEELADHITELTVKEVTQRVGEGTEDLTRDQMAARRDADVKKCVETGSPRKIKCLLETNSVADLESCE